MTEELTREEPTQKLTRFERTGNPFPGLRPFETEEYNLFFGREGQSDELLARLARTRFLAVVGTSGSGKSSLIRAGLQPALYGGLMASTGSGWRIAVVRPGHDPLGNLARALAADSVLGSPEVEDVVEASIIETTLRRSTLGLADAVRQARLPAGENVLVVVDQFEELFRFRAMRDQQGTDDEASAFVKLLLEAPRRREVPVYVVLTMRSDFLGDCAQFQGLPEAINDGQYLIPRMTRDERRMAITGPASVGDGEISPPLVNRLLNDVGDNPDQLPILQHALMRTWDYWSAHRRGVEPVGLTDYEAVGTMSNALSRHADEAFDELPDERSRRVAELLFKSLTERGADNREIRRPTRLKEICEIAGASREEVEKVIEVFRREGRSFLMPPEGTALEPETVIDISHESLIRNWERLREWVKEEGESARIYRRLADAAVAYRAGEGGLLDDVTLGWVNRWRERYEPNRAWGLRYHPGYDEAMAYLEESRADSVKRIADAQERDQRELESARAFAEQQARSAGRLRWLLAALAVMLLLALATAGYALNASRVADAARKEAARAAEKAFKAQAEAEKNAHAVEEGAARLKEEKAKVDAARAKAEEALAAQKQAAETARRQTVIARAAEAKAKTKEAEAVAARAEVEKSATQRQLAAERSAEHLLGIASLQRQDYEAALKKFNGVLDSLDKEKESYPKSPSGQPLTPLVFVYENGSVFTGQGEALSKLGKHVDAMNAYQKAMKLQSVVVGTPQSEGVDPGKRREMQLALFDAVQGLAQSYRDLAEEAKAKAGLGGARPSPSPSPSPGAAGDVDPQDAADAARKNYEQSEKYFQEALKIQQEVYKDTNAPALAPSYENLARLYRDLGRFKDAETYYNNIVELRRKQNSAAPEMLSALKELAQFHAGQNDKAGYEKALGDYEEILNAQEGVGGDSEYPALADTYGEMGEVYLGLNDETRSEASFRLARLLQGIGSKFKQITKAGSVAALRSNDQKELLRKSDTGKDFGEAADLFVQLGKYQKAVDFYQTLAIMKNILGDQSGVAEAMLKMARVERDQLDMKEAALDSYQTAEQILRESKTPDPALLAEVLTELGQLFAGKLNKPAEAEQQFKEALDVLATASGAARQTYTTATALAALYKQQGKGAELLAVNVQRAAAANVLLLRNPPTGQPNFDAGEYTEGFGFFTQAVSDNADAYAAQGDLKSAVSTVTALLHTRLNVNKVVEVDVLDAYIGMLRNHMNLFKLFVPPAPGGRAPAPSWGNDAEAAATSRIEAALARRDEIRQIKGRQELRSPSQQAQPAGVRQ